MPPDPAMAGGGGDPAMAGGDPGMGGEASPEVIEQALMELAKKRAFLQSS